MQSNLVSAADESTGCQRVLGIFDPGVGFAILFPPDFFRRRFQVVEHRRFVVYGGVLTALRVLFTAAAMRSNVGRDEVSAKNPGGWGSRRPGWNGWMEGRRFRGELL